MDFDSFIVFTFLFLPLVGDMGGEVVNLLLYLAYGPLAYYNVALSYFDINPLLINYFWIGFEEKYSFK